MGGTVKCSGAAKIKPPFEMGVDNFEKYEDPAGDGNKAPLDREIHQIRQLRNTKTPQGTETLVRNPCCKQDIRAVLRNTKTPQGTETLLPDTPEEVT